MINTISTLITELIVIVTNQKQSVTYYVHKPLHLLCGWWRQINVLLGSGLCCLLHFLVYNVLWYTCMYPRCNSTDCIDDAKVWTSLSRVKYCSVNAKKHHTDNENQNLRNCGDECTDIHTYYGCEQWYHDILTPKHTHINGSNTTYLSKITGKTAHQEESRWTQRFDIIKTIKVRKLQWLGHVMRMSDKSLVKHAVRIHAQFETDIQHNML